MTEFASLETARLVIDRLVSSDIASLVGYKNDAEVAEHQSWPLPYTDELARTLVGHTVGTSLVEGGQLALRLRGGESSGRAAGGLIGDLMVQPVSGVDHAFEVGITIARSRHGRGYASEAMRAIVDAMFALPHVHKLVAYVSVHNAASLRLFDRQGFRREGLLRSSYKPRNHSVRDPHGSQLVDEILFGLTRDEWARPEGSFDVIAFDADDTLWRSEDAFVAAESDFAELIAPLVDDGIDVKAALLAVERKNLHVFGYGVRAFGLSMVETAASLAADGVVPPAVFGRLVEIVRSMLTEPVHLLAHVGSVLEQVGAGHRLVLITKGDLIHQTAKVTSSGLAHHFERIEIVLEKDASTYERIITSLDVSPKRFCMVGNSVRSDVLPVLAVGANAVHVPYHLLWDLEQAPTDHGHVFAELASLADLPAWLAATASTTARDG